VRGANRQYSDDASWSINLKQKCHQLPFELSVADVLVLKQDNYTADRQQLFLSKTLCVGLRGRQNPVGCWSEKTAVLSAARLTSPATYQTRRRPVQQQACNCLRVWRHGDNDE